MNPQIQALFELQKRDRQLTVLERKLTLIPKRLKELEDENRRLKQMVADLSLDKEALKSALGKKW